MGKQVEVLREPVAVRQHNKELSYRMPQIRETPLAQAEKVKADRSRVGISIQR